MPNSSPLPDNRDTSITSVVQPGLITQQLASRNAIQQREGQQNDPPPPAHPNDEDSGHENRNDEETDDTQWGLKIVRRQPASKLDAVDIIAIHGLGGQWKDTWTEPESKVNWPETLLSVDIPEARIMSYGYNSKEYFSKPNADIRDFALDFLVDYKSYRTGAAEKSRPIIFLCHSLGGIVFKQVSRLLKILTISALKYVLTYSRLLSEPTRNLNTRISRVMSMACFSLPPHIVVPVWQLGKPCLQTS
jgi:hypothetical protein